MASGPFMACMAGKRDIIQRAFLRDADAAILVRANGTFDILRFSGKWSWQVAVALGVGPLKTQKCAQLCAHLIDHSG